jgi:hypothetical protein
VRLSLSPFISSQADDGPTIRILSRDTFTSANGTALLSHSPDKGPAWSQSSGGTAGFTIQSYSLSRTDPVIRHAFMDVGSADVKLSVNVTHVENLIGLLIRRSDNSHYWEVFYDFANSGWQMSLVNGGPDTFKGPLLPGSTGTVTLEAKGNVITATGPLGHQHTEVSSALLTNPQVGIIVNGFGGIASTVDDWLVTAT